MSEKAFLDEVKTFTETEYATALFKGSRLSAKERAEIVKKLSEYTGLSEAYIDGANLRIEIMKFAKEILRDDQKVVGRFDSRIIGVDANDTGENFERTQASTSSTGFTRRA